MSLLSRHRSTDHLPELDARALAELDALDAALAGDEITDEALAALVRDVRAAAPEMRPEATQHLNERVTARFGMPAGVAGKRAGLRGRFSAPVLAAASIVLVGTVVSVGVLATSRTGHDDAATSAISHQVDAAGANEGDAAAPSTASSAPASSAGAGAATEQDGDYLRGGADASAASTAPSTSQDEMLNGFVDPSADAPAAATSKEKSQGDLAATVGSAPEALRTNRAVERSVDLQVRVKNGGLPDAAGKVSQITRDANGYVATSGLSLGGKGSGSATFSLRVDSTKLDRAIDRLSGLGTVTAQNESSRDITSAVDSAQGRLDDANQVRKALLRALAKADTDGEIASLRARIAENRRQRVTLDAQLKQVQRRADLTTIDFTLTAPSKGDPAADDGSWSLGDAASDAWSVLRTVLGGLLVGVAFAAPFALLAALGWGAYVIRRRRARERALDA